jgi:isoquinoline 1-oxidoreductase beta subunit
MKDLQNVSLNRRGFIGAGVAASALVLAVGLPGCGRQTAQKTSQQLNAFVILEPDGSVTVLTPFVEMGQGVHTAIPMLVAEELDVSMDQINVREAPLTPEYRLHFGGAMRVTGSSLTIKNAFIPLRQAGATARAMLLQSAAEEWNVPIVELTTASGQVNHAPSGRSAAYGEFVANAAQLTPPEDVPLKDPADFRLIGTSADRLDAVEKADGSALFGIDIAPPDLLVAAVKQSPVLRGSVRRLDAEAALKMPGVVAVEIIPNGAYSMRDYGLIDLADFQGAMVGGGEAITVEHLQAALAHQGMTEADIKPGSAPPDLTPDETMGTIAVVADSFWHAQAALEKVDVEYEAGAEGFSDEAYSKLLRSRIQGESVIAESAGDINSALENAASSISAVYEVPLLAHTTMETMNCTAWVQEDRCTVWTGSQNADWIAKIAAMILAIPIANVTVNTPFLGGGFGRRTNSDYAIQAISLAKKLPGRPIKLIWSREEDIQHDFYRPQIVAQFQAGFDADNNPVAFRHINVGDGAQRQQGLSARLPFDPAVMASALHQPYDIPNKSIEHVLEEAPIPLGFWRSVDGAHNGFFIESFMDEMAHATNEDPVAFRRRLLDNAPRFRAVLDLAAEMAGWREGPWQAADGRMHAMGVALHEDHHTIVAEIAEVSVDELGQPKVHKVWCSVDCGIVVNPSIATMQIESGIAFGLSAALMEKVEVRDGKVTNNNFNDYPILNAQQMPDIEVQFIASDAAPTGLGEPATPPIPAALCNALFTLTGERIRTLPVGRLQT